jgi:hypothetical protein
MPKVRCKKRCDCSEMQEMSQQEPTMEETGTREVASSFFFPQRIFERFSMLKAVFAQPFFINGTVWPLMFIAFSVSPPVLTSSPQATPMMPS